MLILTDETEVKRAQKGPKSNYKKDYLWLQKSKQNNAFTLSAKNSSLKL